MLLKSLKSFLLKVKYRYLVNFLTADALKLKALPQDQFPDAHAKLLADLLPWKDSPDGKTQFQLATPNLITPGKHKDIIGLIIETRAHPNLIPVMRRFTQTFDRDLVLVCNQNNHDFVQKQLARRPDLAARTQVLLMENAINNGKDYNAIFLSLNFWQLFRSYTHAFVFQTDGTFNVNSSINELKKYTQYDYIGPWWDCRIRPNGLIVDGGIGGFSLRNIPLTIKVVEGFANLGWRGGEDDFFAFHIQMLGGNVAKKSACEDFCLQYRYKPHALCVHQATNMSASDREKLTEEYPDIALCE
jgi:hypothetical protein